MDHLETLKKHGMQHTFSVDAGHCCMERQGELGSTVIWTYPFPETNALGIDTQAWLGPVLFCIGEVLAELQS